MRLEVLTIVVLAAFPTKLSAQWGFLGDERQLAGKIIVDVGVVAHQEKQVVPPYDPTAKPGLPEMNRRVIWLEFRGDRVYCFADLRGSGYEEKPAILLSDSPGSRALYLATLSASISRIDVKVEAVTPIACPG